MDETRRQRRAQFQRIEKLFHRAVDLAPEERAALLAHECDGDPELQRRVEALLAASGEAEEKIGDAVRSAFGRLDGDASANGAPLRIGPYRVIREIGRGGFSTVYLAERADDQFRMKAAIKLVRQAAATEDVARRLRRERQILANLDHPNIARILDGGSTSLGDDSGVPYVVMEYIKGQPIDVFCQHLPIDQRLELFQRVCDAVQYAHANLVLHRDIKPSNILVTADGMPKLLDFGIAKVLAPDLATADTTATARTTEPDLSSTLTRPGARVLTPEYASPEQVEGRPLTTATDVYSLGVLLYLLVTGERPYRFADPSWAEIERVVREVVPTPPSAHDGHKQHDGARGRTRDDLDTVVLQALRKQPERRYASVEQLSEDVRHYLAGEPVSARKDTLGYRMRRFVARHRTAVAAAVLVLVALVTAVVVTTWQARLAGQQRRLAERQQIRAERVAGFLEGLFEDASPYRSLESNLSARQILERGAQRIRSDMAADPELQSTLAATLGRVHREMNLYDEAETLLNMALDLSRGLGDGDAEVAEIQRDLGVLFTEKSDCPRAMAMLDAALKIQNRAEANPLALAQTLHELGQAKLLCDATTAAEPIEQALSIRRSLLGEEAEAVADTESLLAELRYVTGDYAQADALLRKVLEKRRRILGSDHPDVARSLNDLAVVAYSKGDRAGAVPLYQQALAIQRKSLGERHGEVAQTLYSLALATAYVGSPRELPADQKQRAENLFNEAIDVARQVYGEQSPLEADCLHELGNLYWRAEDFEAAEEFFSQALEAIRRTLGADHPVILRTHLALAKTIARRDPTRAEAAFRESVEIHQRLLPADDHRQAFPIVRLGRLRLEHGDAQAAESLFRQAVGIFEKGLSPDHYRTGEAQARLGASLADQDRWDEAEQAYRSSYRIYQANFGDEDARTRRAWDRLENLRERRKSDPALSSATSN